MKPCKAKLPDGKPCPNQVDNGQEYCFFHLAEPRFKGEKEILNCYGSSSSFGISRHWHL